MNALRYGRMTQHAISAMSRVAEAWPEGRRLSSIDVARDRRISKPLVAKVLTVLSQAGLIDGTPGPGGGYRLAREPASISLYDIAELFETPGPPIQCPFGPDWCGHGPRCPLHDSIVELREHLDNYLRGTTLDVFCRQPAAPGL